MEKEEKDRLLVEYFMKFNWYGEWEDTYNGRVRDIRQVLNTVEAKGWLRKQVKYSSKSEGEKWIVRKNTWDKIIEQIREESKHQHYKQAIEILNSRIGSDFWENRNTSDDVLNPNHYTRFKITPRQYIVANKLDWDAGNVIKYISRHDGKNGVEDLRKAIRYIEFMIERIEGHNG